MAWRPALTVDRGVSPVIGVALMIAITVVLGAVLGVVFLGFDARSSAPDVSADVQWEDGSTDGFAGPGDDAVEIVFTGSESVDVAAVSIIIDSTRAEPAPSSTGLEITMLPSGEIEGGDRVVVAEQSGNDAIRPGATLRVVWNAGEGQSYVLVERQVPAG